MPIAVNHRHCDPTHWITPEGDTAPVESWSEALVKTLYEIDGRITVEYRDRRFYMFGRDDPEGPRLSVPEGVHDGVEFSDLESVKDWLYQRYLTPEGR